MSAEITIDHTYTRTIRHAGVVRHTGATRHKGRHAYDNVSIAIRMDIETRRIGPTNH